MSMELCEKISGECQRQGKSLTKVMSSADLSVSVFYRWKEGKSRPRPRSLQAIAAALGIPASSLCSGLSDDVEVTAVANSVPELRASSIDSPDVVFIGLAKSDYNTLAPFIDALKARVIEVPEGLAKGLQSLIERATLLLTAESPLTVSIAEMF